MATKNPGVQATLGQVAANKGGTHGGINPAGGKVASVPAHGLSGNPGTEFPWDGADATPKDGALPPLTHLGGS